MLSRCHRQKGSTGTKALTWVTSFRRSLNLLTSAALNCHIDWKFPCQLYIQKILCFHTEQDKKKFLDFSISLGVPLNEMIWPSRLIMHFPSTAPLLGCLVGAWSWNSQETMGSSCRFLFLGTLFIRTWLILTQWGLVFRLTFELHTPLKIRRFARRSQTVKEIFFFDCLWLLVIMTWAEMLFTRLSAY